MPVFRDHISLAVSKKLKAYVNFEAGVTKGRIPTSWRESVHRNGNGQAVKEARRSGDLVGGGLEKPPMFFLVGQAKSGTSWLMNLLHAHPEIMCRGEGKLFGKDAPRSLYGALGRSRLLSEWLERNPWTLELEEDPDLEDLMRVLVEYMMADKLARSGGKRIVGDKTPLMSEKTIEETARICPDSRVIHIVRDGRDVAVSTAHHLWNNGKDEGGPIPLNEGQIAKRDAFREDPSSFGADGESLFAGDQLEKLAGEWSGRTGAAIRDGERLFGENYLQLSYEDMLVHPFENARRVIRFLDADASESVVRECIDAVSFERNANDRKPGEEDNTSFYRKGVAGDWKGVFNAEDRETYKQGAREMLIELGYEKDDAW